MVLFRAKPCHQKKKQGKRGFFLFISLQVKGGGQGAPLPVSTGGKGKINIIEGTKSHRTAFMAEKEKGKEEGVHLDTGGGGHVDSGEGSCCIPFCGGGGRKRRGGGSYSFNWGENFIICRLGKNDLPTAYLLWEQGKGLHQPRLVCKQHAREQPRRGPLEDCVMKEGGEKKKFPFLQITEERDEKNEDSEGKRR